jgi:hypothetical protein
VQQSNAEAIDLQKNIGRVFQQVAKGSSELAAKQSTQWDLNRGLATELQSSLESMREDQVQSLLGAFGVIHTQLVSTEVPISE